MSLDIGIAFGMLAVICFILALLLGEVWVIIASVVFGIAFTLIYSGKKRSGGIDNER